MLLLVAKAHETLLRIPQRNVGRFCGPRNHHRMADSVRAGFLWAADNDAFNGFNPVKFERMLDDLEGVQGCLFVTCPDVVADAAATFHLYLKWSRPILGRGLPLGYVAQDGATPDELPWNGMSALFVGGSTEWKLSVDAARIVEAAKDRGKWVHMGRVNTWRRLEYAKSIGVDSVDGTKLSMWTDTYLPRFSEMAASPPQIPIGGTR